MDILEQTDFFENDFTDDDLIECATREIAMRESVYSNRVATGKMSQEKAKREIAMMKMIEQILIAYFLDTKSRHLKKAANQPTPGKTPLVIQAAKDLLDYLKKYKDKTIMGKMFEKQIRFCSSFLAILELQEE